MPCVNAAKTKVVPCDSPEAAFSYKDADLKALGLEATSAKAVAPAEDKAVAAPAANKAGK